MDETIGRGQTPPEPLRQALAAAGIAESGAAVEPVSLGNRKETYLVHPDDGDAVVVQHSDDGTLRTEAVLLERISVETAVPVPRVVATGGDDGGSYLVTERVAGENLHYRFAGLDSRHQRSLASAFGRHLASLHEQFRFDGFGRLRLVDGALRAPPETDGQSWLESYGTAAVDGLPEAFDDVRADLRAALAEPAVPASKPRLFPWDFRPGNALVNNRSLAAVLDWERPLAADPALSVAKAEYLVAAWYVDESEPLREAFREGYTTVRPMPTVGSAHRVAAIADSAVDSRGAVTNPKYPELDREASVQFHRAAFEDAL